MAKLAHILLQWMGMIAISFALVDYARAENLPDMWKRHDTEIRELRDRISKIETQLKSFLKEKGVSSLPAGIEEPRCIDVPAGEPLISIEINETWVGLSGRLKIRVVSIYHDIVTSTSKGIFKSNIEELDSRLFNKGRFLDFTIGNCKYTILVVNAKPEVGVVVLQLLDF